MPIWCRQNVIVYFGKAEWMNPGGSVKDRAAARMILDGELRGSLGQGQTIFDATSGNTGVAYAMIGAARGYRVKLCVPANTEAGTLAVLRAYGAEVVLTDPALGMDDATREARRILSESPRDYFFPDQLNNDANWRAHFEGTAREIWEQTGGRVHCKMGGRSSKAVEFLRSVGFRKAKNLLGGINAWAEDVDRTLAKY
jgi:cysteine synthase B